MITNDIDTFVVRAEKDTYCAKSLIPTSKFDSIHAWIDRKSDELCLRVSAKVLKTPDEAGSILSVTDVERLVPIIKSHTGVCLTADCLCNARLTRVDIKKDIHFKTDKLKHVISSFREMCCISTNKNEILTYCNDVGYENSLVIKSTFKTVKDSICIYDKLYEMWLKRHNDKGYYYSFSDNFKEDYKDVIRFERRLQWAKALRKALHISQRETVTLLHVFNCPYDLVAEKVESLLGNFEEIIK